MPPLPDFDSPMLLGALEIGAFISIFMFGTVVMQAHIYYQNCANDSRFLVYFITLIILLELGHALATAHSVWWATITIANLSIKPGNSYAIAACTLYSAVITFLVKVYYVNRVRQLSSKTWLAVIGWFFAGIDFGSSLAVSYEAFRDVPLEPDNFELQRNWGWLITTSLGLSSLVDVFIAAMMVYFLKQVSIRAYSGPSYPMKNSAELLNRLLLWTIETGLLTSVASVVALICFHAMEFNYVWFAVYLPLAKLYSNSLLASLNARPARRKRLGIVQVQPSPSASSLRSTARSPSRPESPSTIASFESPRRSWSNGNLSFRRSTIATSSSSTLKPQEVSTQPRRSTVGSRANSETKKDKVFLSRLETKVDTQTYNYPRQKINSVVEFNGKQRSREQYAYANRPRSFSRLHTSVVRESGWI